MHSNSNIKTWPKWKWMSFGLSFLNNQKGFGSEKETVTDLQQDFLRSVQWGIRRLPFRFSILWDYFSIKCDFNSSVLFVLILLFTLSSFSICKQIKLLKYFSDVVIDKIFSMYHLLMFNDRILRWSGRYSTNVCLVGFLQKPIFWQKMGNCAWLSRYCHRPVSYPFSISRFFSRISNPWWHSH